MSEIFYPLSNQQKSIWYIEQVHNDTSIGIISGTVHITANIDYSRLRQAIKLFIEEEGNLRTRIKLVHAEPQQFFSPYESKEIEHFDLSQYSKSKIENWNATFAIEPMPLIDSDLYYFATVSFGENHGGFLMKLHHLICDGWSHVMIANRIMAHYIALINGKEYIKADHPLYIDYLERENAYINSAQYEKDRLFWAESVKKIPDQVELKYAHTTNNTVAKRKTYHIKEDITARLKEFCYENGISVFSFFLTVLTVYVYRITGRTVNSFGTPVLNRKNAKEKNTVGMFISAVPLILETDENYDFLTYNKEILKYWFSVLRHQQFPYEGIFKEAKNCKGPISRIYDITISYQNAVLHKDMEFDGIFEGVWHFCGHQVESLCIHINEREADGTLTIDYDYLTDVFTPDEIDRIHSGIYNITNDALSHPEKQIRDIELVDDSEKNILLNEFNQTVLKYNTDRTVHEIIEKHAAQTPDAIAVIFEGRHFTYRELKRQSDLLAAHLLQKGLKPDDIVAVMFERSPDILVAMLGVLKAGGAFLPVDPSLPNDRITYMLRDSHAAFVVTHQNVSVRFSYDHSIQFSSNRLIYLNNLEPAEFHAPTVSPSRLAYLIYTSGSTGMPKGVMVEHHSLINFYEGLRHAMNYAAGLSVISIASVGFDVFVFETFPTLMNGMTVVLTNEKEQKDPAKIADLIFTYNVDKIFSTPSRLRIMLADTGTHRAIAGIKEILCGGEEFPQDLYILLKFITNAKIYNQYGPTETTIGVTIKNITSELDINIGKPMANVYAYVLNKDLKLMPADAVGELYIGGSCLARGYIGNTELTKEKFIANPYQPGSKLYKTGDLAKWLPSGELVFLGRTDSQIKIRGYRIELQEIEKQMTNIRGIKSAVVIDRMDNNKNKYLCAYYLSDAPISANNIKQLLHTKLPQYMIPAFFVRMQSFPLNANGKVDTAALPAPAATSQRKSKYIAPANSIEQQLIEIWQKNLGVNEIGVTDNYFALGGDSLNMVIMLIDINKAFDTNLSFSHLFESPTIRDISKSIADAQADKLEPLQKAPKMSYYPLSASQRRLYILNTIDQNKLAYNMPGAFIVQGTLDVNQLENVFKTLIKRHEVLRTSFELMGTEIVQIIQSDVHFEIERISASSISDAVRLFVRPFDLSKPPLFRAGIMNMGPGKFLLLVDMHHIVSDGASSALLMEEINTLYSGGELAPNLFQYKDYVLWSQKRENSVLYEKQREYWLGVFKDNIPILELPLDFQRPAAVDFKGNKIRFALDKSKTAAVVKFCRENGVSLFMFLFSIWNVFLSKITGQDDIVVGTPSLGRQYPNLDNIVGVFINTLPIRSRPEQEKTYRAFLEEVRQNTLNALDNQDYPYDQLLDILPIRRDLSRNPLFDTLFVFQNVNAQQLKLGNLSIIPEELDIGISKLDLSLEAVEYNEKLHFTFEYAASLFEEKTIIKFISYYETLISNILANPEDKLFNIECITESDRQQLLNEYNKTSLAYDPVTIDTIFDRAALETPEKTAVVFHEKEISFGALKNFSDVIAAGLLAKGISKGSVVGLLCRRNIEMIAGIFGIMKSGAAYMPIDPDYPEERMKYMLSDSNASAIVYCDGVELPKGFKGHLLKISSDGQHPPVKLPPRRHTTDDKIYVLYTSGSTGKPKGVMIRHLCVTNLFHALQKELPITREDIILCSTTFCFDVFAVEGVAAPAMGLTVVMADEEQQRLPWLMADIIHKNNVTIMQATPSRMRVLIEDWNIRSCLKKIKFMTLAGEALPLALLKKLQSITPARIFNMYGPTETTVYSTSGEMTHAQYIHIGRPLANTQIYVLNDHARLLPPGAVGEMYIGGDGVALGYLNKPELTANSFISSPFKPDCKIYKTGDLIRFEKDGTITYIGRSDHQVKIRGLRIELGEIENCIQASGMVSEVAVMPIYSNDEIVSLCAYITVQNAYCDTIKLKQHIAKYLPDYMVPSQFQILDKLPLTPSGKIDRKSLPKPDYIKQTSSNVVFPTNDTEKELYDIWAKVLKKDDISIDRSFFEMGGDSLTVIIVQMQYYKKNFHLSTKDFYRYQTIAEQAEIIMRKTERKEAVSIGMENFPMLENLSKASPAPKLKHVLITGATGFFGAHILKEIMRHTSANVYCIVRGENQDYKLSEALKYYHGMRFMNHYRRRIFSVGGDITKVRFGLGYKEYDDLALQIDTVVHCAADVRHYGDVANFFSTNVEGTNQIIEFTAISHAHLYHVSTVSVSGNKTNDKSNVVFSENDFYVGQNYHENEYIKSKFEAEKSVIHAMISGMDATILRIGNLTGRYRDGVFQKNIYANAFYRRLRALIMLKCVPDKYRGMELEFTPVDTCARAAFLIVSSENTSGGVFHLKNDNTITLDDFVSYCTLEKNGFEFIDENKFFNRLKESAKNENNDYAAAFIQDLDENGKISFTNNIHISSSKTIDFLKKKGFSWPKTNKWFIKKVVRYMKNTNFIRED